MGARSRRLSELSKMARALGNCCLPSPPSPGRTSAAKSRCSGARLGQVAAAGGNHCLVRHYARLADLECAARQPRNGLAPVRAGQHKLELVEDGEQREAAALAQQRVPGPGGPGNGVLLQASPLSVLALAALPGADQVTALIEPWAEIVRGLDLPYWLLHWGHPGNMAVVLFAMGGYGSWLGWQIRLSDDAAVKAKAKEAHPKILAGLFFFFTAGAVGGVTSLVTTGKPIFESPHALTGFIGLALLTIQTLLPVFFEGNPSIRSVHAWFGSGIMALFLVHFALGLQLGFSS